MSEALYEKSIKCPICNNSFSSMKVRSSLCRVEKRDEDFCVHYKDNNPMHYEIFVCPHCGYAASENSYENLSENEGTIIKEILSGKVVNRSFCGVRTIEDAIDSYKLALFLAQASNTKKSILAGLALKLAWLYRGQQNEKEMVFIQHSLENYQAAYDSENLPLGNLDEISVQYLLGELSRRLGKLNDAIFWFSKAVVNPLKATNPRIEKMAREQWQMVKEQNKK